MTKLATRHGGGELASPLLATAKPEITDPGWRSMVYHRSDDGPLSYDDDAC